MQLQKVRQTEILFISFLISLLHNSPRLLEFIGFLDYTHVAKTAPPSLVDVVFRMSFLFSFSYIILQYNTNLDGYLKKYGKVFYFISSVLFNGVVLFLSTTFYYELYDDFTGNNLYVRDERLLLFILVILLLALIVLSRNLRYKQQIRTDLEERERLIKQNLQNELAALKNQINPHFLFNSLNSLNSLIRDNKKATNFVNQLSYMYRYILQSSHHNLVDINEELKFIESYLFLIKMRYRDRFSVVIDVKLEILKVKIPVLVLQLLVENAVKHNEISNRNPLKVKIYNTKDFLIVENTIQPRSTFVDSTGQGLSNINKRYVLLKEKQIIISNKNNIFSVKMPLK